MDGSLVAVTAIGRDRPGIVAAVTRVLYEQGCNLEDATSTILRGHFCLVLIVRTTGVVDAASLETSLAATARELELVVAAREVGDAAPAPAPTHTVSVYGADHPGIVYRVAALLASMGAGITDLASRVVGDDSDPVYALMMEVAVPSGVELEAPFREVGGELAVDITVRPVDLDVL